MLLQLQAKLQYQRLSRSSDILQVTHQTSAYIQQALKIPTSIQEGLVQVYQCSHKYSHTMPEQCMQQLLKEMQQHIYEEMPWDVVTNTLLEQKQKIPNI